MATTQEIEELKRQWRLDGSWDIEETPGFEEHRGELLAYRKEMEAERDAAIEEYKRRNSEMYRGMWTDIAGEVAPWLNEQAKEGYRVVSITVCPQASIEGKIWQGVYVLAFREPRAS